MEVSDQPFDAESLGDSEDADLIPLQSGEDSVAQLDNNLSHPASQLGELFRITALQLEDPTCVTLLERILSDTFPHGRRLSLCARSCDFCGIIGIICRRILTEWSGGRGVLMNLNFNYWSQTGKRAVIFGLPRLVLWGPFGPEPHIGPSESPVLLVGYGR